MGLQQVERGCGSRQVAGIALTDAKGQIAALTDTLPLAREGAPAAGALGQLADLGTNALKYLVSGGTPTNWKTSADTALAELAKPKGLLRLAGVDAVRTLLDALP